MRPLIPGLNISTTDFEKHNYGGFKEDCLVPRVSGYDVCGFSGCNTQIELKP